MTSDSNKLLNINILPTNKVVLDDFVYVGHPIKKLFETCSEIEREIFSKFINNIAIVLKNFDYTPLVPSLIGHNVERPKNFDMRQIYLSCAKACRISSLFIALPFDDSTGLGMEFQIAYNNHIPIIVLAQKDTRVTGMINENFAKVVQYCDHKEAIKKLTNHLRKNSYHNHFSYYNFTEIEA